MNCFDLLVGKKIGILGLGKTGISCFKVLKDIAGGLLCYDDKTQVQINFSQQFGQEYLVDHESYLWKQLDYIVVSPGIPLNHPKPHHLVSLAFDLHIPILNDVDLLYNRFPKAKYIGVTATNGKSTTTALTTHIMQSCGYNYIAGGNIGTPCLDLPYAEGYVLELSSFQLELIKNIKMDVVALLNITPDHSNRYKNFAEYVKAKTKILQHLNSNGSTVVLGIDNDIVNELYLSIYQQIKTFGQVIPISTKKVLSNGITVKESFIIDNLYANSSIEIGNNPSLIGLHNCENIAASYAISCKLGCDPKSVIKAIEDFGGLPHRLQYLGRMKNLHFYNDSKATNPESAAKAITSLDNIYWLAGGIAETSTMTELLTLYKHIKRGYFFGKAKDFLASIFGDKIPCAIFANLNEAFFQAVNDSLSEKEGEICNILLSPACKSFDQFSNFEDRGNCFINLYKSLAL